jgi:hypothetical protein
MALGNVASATCSASACHVGTCRTDYANCNNTDSDGCEVNLQTNANNCGTCGNVCGANATCVAGGCACALGTMLCGTSCVDTQRDVRNCGSCGNACSAGNACIAGACMPAPPCTALSTPRVLIYGPAGSAEQTYLPTGSITTVATETMWRGMTAADFASYDLIVVGSAPTSGTPYLALYDTRAVWGTAITGRVVVDGLDASDHAGLGTTGAATYLRSALRWLTSGRGTALYVGTDTGYRSLDFLSPFGAFTSRGTDGDSVHIVDTTHPVMTGSTDTSMSTWGYSYHSILTVPSTFTVLETVASAPTSTLIVARDVACSP